jgi:hypothetical protein
MIEVIQRSAVGLFAVFIILAGVYAAVPQGADPELSRPADRFDAKNAVGATVDTLVTDFGRNEVSANDKWNAASLRLVGYVSNITDTNPPVIRIKGSTDYAVSAETPAREEVAAVQDGETVELLCVGASSSYGMITAHDCVIFYHGKRRKSDPYWPSPDALQDPL